MDDYSIDRIEGNIAVLYRRGMSIEIELSSLPEGVKEGDVLCLDKDGKFVLDTEKTQRIRSENSAVQDEVFDNSYEIRPDVNRKTLVKEAESILFNSTNAELKHLFTELCVMAVGLLLALGLVFFDIGGFSRSIIEHNISKYLGTLCLVFFASVGVLIFAASVVAALFTVRKLRRHVNTYKFNLRRAEEKLNIAGDYTGIAPEVFKRYDNIFKQISISLKNREKKT